MGTIVSKIAEEIEHYGSLEAYMATLDASRPKSLIPMTRQAPPVPPKAVSYAQYKPAPTDEHMPFQVHHLKTWPKPFDAVRKGFKTFEIRLNDRNYQVGDLLVLEEWNPITKMFSGKYERRKITCILSEPVFGIKDGFVVLGIVPVDVPNFRMAIIDYFQDAAFFEDDSDSEAITRIIQLIDNLRSTQSI